eukprot:CAMPEP_0114556818 /NCGR_PEP_ID=MMETSP0114-20121206/9489_1 /TAXON_ID=31324 /ORGANISM="Goniomonas sp, Strain m" /LENGTH=205 /DNA_ID=CAMNT_0001742043 /DNA_START=23 /DNA_END=640 /DNA_ORIENTATION=+
MAYSSYRPASSGIRSGFRDDRYDSAGYTSGLSLPREAGYGGYREPVRSYYAEPQFGAYEPRYAETRYAEPRYERLAPRQVYAEPRYERAYEPHYAEPRYAEPRYERAYEPRYAEPRYAEPRYAEPRYAEPRYERSYVAEPRYAEPRYEAARSYEPRYADSYGASAYPASSYARSASVGRDYGSSYTAGTTAYTGANGSVSYGGYA